MRRHSGLAVALVFAACSSNLPLDDDALVRCATDADCPGGRICVNAERCVDPDRLDATSLTLATPPNDALLPVTADVVFAWSTVSGAARYRLDVSTDSAFANVVVSVWLPQTSHSQRLDAGTYYWRVTSDITDPSGTPAVRRFGAIDDTLYVYCDTDTCDATADELGTSALPYHAINRALTAILGTSATRVHIASKPNGAPYAERVNATEGITLSGGYSADFTERNGRTDIALADTPLFAAFIEKPTAIEHFTFTNTRADEGSTVASIFRSGNALVFTDVALETVHWSTDVLHIEDRIDDAGPRFVDSEITGVLSVDGFLPRFFEVVDLDNAAVTFSGTRIRGSTRRSLSKSDNDVAGILALRSYVTADTTQVALDLNGEVEEARAVLLNASVLTSSNLDAAVVGPETARAYGVQLAAESAIARLSGGTISARAPQAVGIDLTEQFELLTASGVRINATATAFINAVAIGIRASRQRDEVNVLRSVVVADAMLGLAQGLYLFSESSGLVANNTILVRGLQQQGVYASLPLFRFVNNAMVGEASSCATGLCRVGLRIDGATAYDYLGAIAHNAFVGFPTTANSCGYARGAMASQCERPVAVSTAATRPYIAGNRFIDEVEDAALDARYQPAASSLLNGSGIDPMSDLCRQTRPDSPSIVVAAPACGGVTHDFDDQPFAVPPPSGALRPAP